MNPSTVQIYLIFSFTEIVLYFFFSVPLRLNRPLIAILNDLGVRKRIFLKLQEAMIQNLTDMLLDEDKATAYLNARTPISDFKFKDLSRSGIGLTAEPFFRTLLLALHRYYIGNVYLTF